MKNLMIIALVAFTFISLNTKAQQSDAIITKSVVINASADDVWERLRQLDKLEEIVPSFLATSWIVDGVKPGVGAKRSCAAPGQPKGEASYTEQVIEYDDEKRFYSYAVIEGVPAKNMLNMFKVVDLGYKKCMVVWNSTGWEFIENPNMTKEQFMGFLSSAGDEMMTTLYKLHNGKS